MGRSQIRLLAKLANATRSFRAVLGRQFLLRYDPAVDPLDVALVLQTLELEIGVLEQRFDRRLRAHWLLPAPLPVYLFRSAENLAEVYGEPVGGFASWRDWLIAVHARKEYEEMIPHELAHIFAGWWNPNAPKLLQEGLAVWAQRTCGGRPVDGFVGRRYDSAKQALAGLLGPFPDAGDPDRYWYYILVGSFTGFLLRRSGWHHYRAFYQDKRVTLETLPARFEKHYGLNFETAGRVWFGQLPGCLLVDPPFEGWI
ncbi:hypothetical protein [Fimbriiglobus ruber]|uniref:hypothetical protein n=1 Tax=Fimbriiglobus ruber TaxID=1908690 RepID=UPI00117AB77B|nr:hypothetical protein [Fimbriiglobus ruber]